MEILFLCDSPPQPPAPCHFLQIPKIPLLSNSLPLISQSSVNTSLNREIFLGVESLSFAQLTIKRTEWGQQSIKVLMAQGEAFKHSYALLPNALGNLLFLLISSVCANQPLWGLVVVISGPSSAPTEVSGQISIDFKMKQP